MRMITFRRGPLRWRLGLLAAACAFVAGVYLRPEPAAPATANPAGATPIARADSPDPRVALTFDVTYGEAELARVLHALDTGGVKATFFVSHLWAMNHPQQLQSLEAAGHEVGTLGLKFIDLTGLEEQELTANLTTAQGLLFRILAHPVRCFRPPMGRWDAEVLQAARTVGMQTITWRVDGGDGITPSPPAREIASRVVQEAERGDIIRLHASDFAHSTAEALPLIVRGLQQRGLQIVPVKHLME